MKRHPALVPLSREHNTALVLAFRIEHELPGSEAATVGKMYDLLTDLWTRGLLPHFRAENECLLARLIRHVPADDEMVVRTQRDHLGIEALVADMRDDRDIEARRRRLLDFAARIRTHIRWEEEVLFEATQERLAADELAALGSDITERVGDGTRGAHEVATKDR